jgi:hypothetical protein
MIEQEKFLQMLGLVENQTAVLLAMKQVWVELDQHQTYKGTDYGKYSNRCYTPINSLRKTITDLNNFRQLLIDDMSETVSS